MPKQQIKKLFTIIVGLFLALYIGFVGVFNIPQAKAAAYTFSEDFSAATYKDNNNTTADWNLGEKKLKIKSTSGNYLDPSMDIVRVGNNEFISYIVWRSNYYSQENKQGGDVFIQGVDATGNKIWETEKRVNAKDNIFPTGPSIVITSTSYGKTPYAYVTWSATQRGSYYSPIIYFQKFNLSTGIREWENDLEIGDGGIIAPVLDIDEDSNVIIAWQKSTQIGYIDKYNSEGKKIWRIKLAENIQGDGKAIAMASDPRFSTKYLFVVYFSNNNLRLQKIDITNGDFLFGKEGIIITKDIPEKGVDIRVDEELNAYVIWRSNSNKLFVQKFNNNGDKVWSGDAVINTENLNIDPNIAFYGNSVISSWSDKSGTNSPYEIYFSQLNNKDGKIIGRKKIGTGYKNDITGIPEWIRIVWSDKRDNAGNFNTNNNSDIYLQRFSALDDPVSEVRGKPYWNKDVQVNSDETFYSEGRGQSIKINTTSENIIEATITANDTQPNNTLITYQLSNDGGKNWEQATSGQKIKFANTGSDLRWQAVLSTKSSQITPVINRINISYTTEPSVTNKVVSPNGGETFYYGEYITVKTEIKSEEKIYGTDSYYLVDDSAGYKEYLGGGSIVTNTAPGIIFQATKSMPASNNYKILAIFVSGNIKAADSSDAPFSITSPTQPSLTVSLHSLTPASKQIPIGSSNIEVLRFMLSVNDYSDVAINSITVKRANAGSCAFQNLKLYDAVSWVQVGSTVSALNTECEAKFNFNNSILVSKSGSKVLSLKLDVPNSAKIEDMFAFQVSGISGDPVNVRWLGLPVTGNTMTIIAGTPKTGTVTVVSPNGGETFVTGLTYPIKWTSSGFGSDAWAQIQLRDSSNPSQMVSLIVNSMENTGVYSWTVPTTIPNGKYLIWVTIGSGSSSAGTRVLGSDFSDAPFTIVKEESTKSSITVISPNGGEKWEIGHQYEIKWAETNDTEARGRAVSLWKNNQWLKELFFETERNTSVYWTPDYSLQPDSDYKIRVWDTSKSDYTGSDDSDNYFSIIKREGTQCFADNTIIKLFNDPKVYEIINCQKKWIRSIKEFEKSGYKWSDIQGVDSPVIEAYPDYLKTSAVLLKAVGHDKVYRMVDGKRIWVPSIPAFNAQGLKWEDIQEMTESEIDHLPRGNLFQVAGDPKVYYLTESGLKRHIPTPQVFDSYGNKWENIIKVTAEELNAYPDNIFIKTEGDYKVYKLEDGKKRWIKTDTAFNRLGYEWDKIAPVSTVEIDAYPIGDEIE